MDNSSNITIDYIQSILDYDIETGFLTWKTRPLHFFKKESAYKVWNTRYSGKRAGNIDKEAGYRVIAITPLNSTKTRNFSEHRIAWAIYYGRWPQTNIDHINCVKSDNRIINLREASAVQNAGNSTKRRNNKTGIKGVTWSKDDRLWYAWIGTKGKSKYLGCYKCPAAASFAYQIAANKKYSDFARTF